MSEEVKENLTEEAVNEPAATEEEGKKADKKAKKEAAELKKQLAELTEKNTKLETAAAEAADKYLRLAAEYKNFRERSAKEKDGIYADAYADALKGILPVIDNLELALKNSQSDPSKIVEGVQMVMKQFGMTLEKLGVEEIPTETFDPNVHNAVMHVEDDSVGENAILEVFQKGYRKGDKIVRYAMVKVAN